MRKFLLSILTLLILLSMTNMTSAWFTSRLESNPVRFSAGDLKIEAESNLDFLDMEPGESRTGSMVIRNVGSLDFVFTVEVIEHYVTKKRGAHNEPEVVEWFGDELNVVVTCAGRQLFSGTLAELVEDFSVLDWLESPLGPGEELVYGWEVEFAAKPGNQRYQGVAVSWLVVLEFTATQWAGD